MSYARALYKSTLSGVGVTGPTGAMGYTGPTGSNGTSYTGPTGTIAGVTSVSSSGLAYGATVTSNGYLQLGEATNTYPGLVTTGSQIFAGAKSFVSDVSVNHLIVGSGGSKHQFVTVSDTPHYLSSSDYGKLIRVVVNNGEVHLPTAAISPYGSSITIDAANNFYYVKIYSSGGSICWGSQTFGFYIIESRNNITFTSDGSDWYVTSYIFPSKSIGGGGDTHTMYSPYNVLINDNTMVNIYLPQRAACGSKITIRKIYLADQASVVIHNSHGYIGTYNNSLFSNTFTMDTETYTLELIVDDSNNWFILQSTIYITNNIYI